MRGTIGAALQDAALDPFLTGREHLKLQTALHGMTGAPARERSNQLLERVGLVQAADRRRFDELGIAGMLSKPFDPMELAAQVSGVLGWAE